MIGIEHEARRPASGAGFADAVTFSWGDLDAGLCGVARAGIVAGEPDQGSALALLFSGRDLVAASAHGGVEVSEPDWTAIEIGTVRATVEDPLAGWTVRYAGEEAGFDLRFTATSAPIAFGAGDPAGKAGGQEGYEQLCHVQGTVTTVAGAREVDCLGQRGHAWGVTDWDGIELARTVSAWLDPDRAVTVSAVRPAGARSHADEALSAFLLDEAVGGAEAVAVDEPRLSTTYDAEGRQRRAGLELWVGEEDELPRRLAGEVLCGSSLDLGRLRLDCAFFQWRMEGRTGIGRYDVLRRA